VSSDLFASAMRRGKARIMTDKRQLAATSLSIHGVTMQRPETLTSVVAKFIHDAIIRGEYVPGTPLREIPLAQQLGTSRGTVREALHSLAEQGLVEIQPHRGSFVLRITRRRAIEVYELRELLEGYAVGLAVERGCFSGDEARSLEELSVELEAIAREGNPLAIIEAESRIHHRLWSTCGNGLLRDFISLLDEQTRYLKIYHGALDHSPDEEVAEHRRLVEAALSGDPERARRAVSDHIRVSGNLLLATMPPDTANE